MGLEQFTSDDEKTSSPNKNEGPSKGGIDQFLDDSEEDEIEIEGGFTIPNDDKEEWDTEVVKIYGGPGCGKTTTMVGNTDIENFQGILQRMFERRNPEEVMLIAYTRAAADEAKERLVKLTDVSESKADDRVTTIHSLAMRFNSLRPKDIVEIRWANDKYNFCDSVGLEYNMNVQEDNEQMMDEPDDEGHLFFRINSWLKSKMKPAEEWVDCPLSDSWERTGEEFIKFSKKWEEYKNEKNIWEFDDAILECVLNEDVIDTKFLFIDEVQDLYPLQQAFIDNQFGKVKRIFLAGDDDQCLPPTAPVELRNEHGSVVQKEIQDVEVGDRVQSMYGGGDYGYREVTDVTVKDVVDKRFKTFTTESGKELTVTDNHKLFARIPKNDDDILSEDIYYIYMMKDYTGKWRIGQTENLYNRMTQQRTAKCIVPLDVTNSKKDALLREKELSLRHSIPTITFTNYEGEVLSQEEVKNKLYDRVDTNMDSLEIECGVDLSNPPLITRSTSLGRVKTLNINIQMCSDIRQNYVAHELNIYTSDKEYMEELDTLDILNKSEYSESSFRYRKKSSDLQMLGNLAEHIKEGLQSSEDLNSDIVTKMKVSEDNKTVYVTPAKNVVKGMEIPVLDGDNVVLEKIVDVKTERKSTEVYDLTIDGTHNFSSGQVFSHNTIYQWAGAEPDYFLDMQGNINEEMPELWSDKDGYWDSEGEYILDKSWRMPSEILELSKMCIKQVSVRKEKSIKPHHKGGDFIPLHSPMPERVIELINPEDTMILFRAKYQMSSFQKHLIESGIPFMDRFKTWRDSMLIVRDALASLKNENKEMMTGNEAQRLAKELPDKAFNNRHHRDRIVKNYSKRRQVKCESFIEHFRYRAPTDYNQLRRWTAKFRDDDRDESLNYYQQKAIRNNLLQHNEHLDPHGIKLETIHSSKGREADTIILSLDSTQSVQENIPVGQNLNDAERRLYYVGLTRSENRLVVCQDLDNDSPTVTLDELFGRDWRNKYSWANGPVDERGTRRQNL